MCQRRACARLMSRTVQVTVSSGSSVHNQKHKCLTWPCRQKKNCLTWPRSNKHRQSNMLVSFDSKEKIMRKTTLTGLNITRKQPTCCDASVKGAQPNIQTCCYVKQATKHSHAQTPAWCKLQGYTWQIPFSPLRPRTA